MIQILALRPSVNGGLSEQWFEKGLRCPSVEMLFADPDAILSKIPESERHTLYFTVADCQEIPGRKLSEQWHIPIDVDKLEIGENPNYETLCLTAKIICETIKVKFEETAVLYTGNGLQLFIGITEPITEESYFDDTRKFYRALCNKIDTALAKAQIAGKADPAVWGKGRLMRFPNTENRKPNKKTRQGKILQSKIVRHPWDWHEHTGLPNVPQNEQMTPHMAEMFTLADSKTILDPEAGCKFMVRCESDPSTVTEPEWYAMLSISGRLPNGRKLSHDLSKGHPGYSFTETDDKITQALENSGPRSCVNIQSVWGKCQTCPHYQTSLQYPILIKGPEHVTTEGTGFHHIKVTEKGPVIGKPDIRGLHIVFKRSHTYVAVEDSGALWRYEDGFYSELMTKRVEEFAQMNFDPKPINNTRKEFLAYAQVENLVSRDFFARSVKGHMNFTNGVLDVSSRHLYPHGPQFGFRAMLPCAYDKDARAPHWEKFLSDVTKNRQDLIDILQEYMGYAFSSMDCRGQKALALLGTGENGKSTFNNVIRKLASKNGYSSVNLKDMLNDQKRYMMEGKLINFAEENSMDAFKDSSLFMNMVTGGEISVKKLYHQPYEYENTTKLVLNFNQLPYNNNKTDGFFRRLLIVPFDAKFSDALGNKDPEIEDKLSGELPGIFNWIMEGYDRYKSQGYQFTKAVSAQNILSEYRKDSDPVLTFIEEEVIIDEQDQIGVNRQELYNSFKFWCDENGIRYKAASRTFYSDVEKTVRSRIPKIGDINYRGKLADDRPRMFRHVRLDSGARQ